MTITFGVCIILLESSLRGGMAVQLEISSLKENKGKSLDFRFEEEFSPIDLGGDLLQFPSPVVVEGTATNVESGILVDSTIKTTIVVDCDRCLKPVATSVDIRAVEEFVTAVKTEVGNHEEKEFRIFKGSAIDLRDMVEENILLSVPMKILCSEMCKGFCSLCGTDLNVKECNCSKEDVDPRMEKLKDWFKE